MFQLDVLMCTTCMPSVHGGQKRVSDLLELELQTVVSNKWIQMWVLNPDPLTYLSYH